MTVTVCAPAKINLDLRILGRRRDDFHEIRTLLQSIQLHDTLSFRHCPGPMRVRSRTRGIPKDRANLVWAAACGLWSALGRSGIPSDVAISIRKRIPVSAGLGGGSSDAASTLRGLCAVWGIAPDRAWLRAVASRVGSDVPFFLDGGAAVARGRGERIRHLQDFERPLWVVLAQPRFGVSTAEAYRWFDAEGRGRRLMSRRSGSLPRGWREQMRVLVNDLEPAVAHRHPEIGLMVARFKRSGAVLAAMTGSGSTVFGLFRHRSAALAARVSARRPGWRMVVSRTVGRSEFARVTAMRREDARGR